MTLYQKYLRKINLPKHHKIMQEVQDSISLMLKKKKRNVTTNIGINSAKNLICWQYT